MCKNEYCLQRDTTDCETDLDQTALVIKTREQKYNKKHNNKRAAANIAANNFNNLVEKCLTNEMQEPSPKMSRSNMATAPTQSSNDREEQPIINNVMLGIPSTSSGVTRSEDPIIIPIQAEDQTDLEKYDFLSPSEDNMDNIMKFETGSPEDSGIENTVISVKCSSCDQVLEILKKLNYNQVQQNAELRGIKTLIAGNRARYETLAAELIIIKQDIKSLLANFHEDHDNFGEMLNGFSFPVNTVTELERLENELGSDASFRNTMVIFLNFIQFYIF